VAGGAAFIKPGKKNEAGETVLEAFTPPQPTAPIVRTTKVASHRFFHFNLTR